MQSSSYAAAHARRLFLEDQTFVSNGNTTSVAASSLSTGQLKLLVRLPTDPADLPFDSSYSCARAPPPEPAIPSVLERF